MEGTDGRPNLLLAGTANKLARYSVDGSWVLLHSTTFCDDGDWVGGRYLVAQLAGLCLVGHTRGGFWDFTLDAEATEVDGQYTYLRQNDSLIALGIESANVLIQSRGFFFLADVTVDGQRDRSGIYWSDFEDTDFLTSGDSQAGYVSLGGDHILAAIELGNSIVFYTNRSIWLASYVGGDVVWTFDRIYTGPDVPWYPRGVVDCGDVHVFVTRNSIRMLLRGERTPREIEWLDKASGAIFNGLRANLLEGMPVGSVDYPRPVLGGCLHLVGWYNPIDRIVSFSWADQMSSLPNWTIHLSLAHRTACLEDHGITAAVMTRQPLPGTQESLRAFLRRTMGCVVYPDLNEHDPFPADYPDAADEPLHLYNATEDPALAPDEGSYCSIIEASDEPCLTHCDPCVGPLRLIYASAEDYCLKEMRWDFDRREQMATIGASQAWNNVPLDDQPWAAEGPNPVAIATYRFDPYYTLFQSDAFIEGKGKNLFLKAIDVDMVALPMGSDMTEAAVPSSAKPWPTYGQGAGGFSAGCMTWNVRDTDSFTCGMEADVPTYAHTAENPEVHLEVEGRYVAYRLYWGGAGNIGPVAFTGLTVGGGSIC